MLDAVDESKCKEDWYIAVQKLQERYEQSHFQGFNVQKYHTYGKCMICNRQPNCLEKNWLTKEKHDHIKYGPNDDAWKDTEAILKSVGMM